MQIDQNKISPNFAAFQALREKARERLQTEDAHQVANTTQIKKLAYPQSTPLPSVAPAYTRNKLLPAQDFSAAKLGQFVDIMV